ncbi:MAG TPA: HAD family phosphatase [Vicinamibacterales bacterium]|nr:HAD family phosphatase [Vicinamibacterales bacterium]
MIAALVFDFDGVLVDSEPLHLRAYQEVLEPLGTSLPREEYYARYLGYDDNGVFRAVADSRGWRLDDRQIAALIAEKTRVFEQLTAGADHLYPGAAACITRLAPALPLGIASGALRHEIETTLRGAGLDRHFRFIVASGDTRATKPAPDPYARAAALHGVAPAACLAIEDSRWGIESAKAAGLWCIGITHTYPVAELLDADAIITSLDELTMELIASLGG